ncbi:4Fe-4S binding protein [Anaerosacchariphilus polymeriproducens]|uniref:4Fe-4S binding protein n=1 Tax=Anaerosacchariphilus polymeriproducens TaxID=1812858 RepID=UPI001F4508FB|nr:4Fe-4S binding protein [Anaerosacchariphilus polymeriproducens]
MKQSGFDAPTVDLDACISCGKCTKFCPRKALVLVLCFQLMYIVNFLLIHVY